MKKFTNACSVEKYKIKKKFFKILTSQIAIVTFVGQKQPVILRELYPIKWQKNTFKNIDAYPSLFG